MSNATTPSPLGINDATVRIDDLMTLLGSGVSSVAVVFTMILYGHYKHLHSPANTLFIVGILGVTLCADINYFLCIFTMTDSTGQHVFSQARCDACGFMEQIHSFVEPFLSTVFWIQIYCMIHKINVVCFRGKREVMWTIFFSWVLGAASAAGALVMDWYRQESQAWCWIASDVMWFKLVFCWFWVGGSFACMCLALANPLCSDTLNTIQKRLLWRRAILGCLWAVVCAIDICARFLQDDQASIVQATCEPILGLLNVLAFLYSERMFSCSALSLPPGGEPTYGFTAAMRYIPDKISEGEQSILISR